MSRHTRDDPRTRAVAQQACALLLGYPDEGLTEQLPLIGAAVAGLPADTGAPLRAFVDHTTGADSQQLREHYVALFDLRRRCSPYLTYWTHGDTRNRGAAILRFREVYRASQVEPPTGELADHLAVVLEFAAVGDPQAGNRLLGEHRAGIELLREALRAAGSPYAHVLDAVVATLPPAEPGLAGRIAALAAAGPATELVGIGGPPLAGAAPGAVGTSLPATGVPITSVPGPGAPAGPPEG